jgi:hypothetical protein
VLLAISGNSDRSMIHILNYTHDGSMVLVYMLT